MSDYGLSERRISRELSSVPIPVSFWVHDSVTDEHRDRAMLLIGEALNDWESVELSRLRFTTREILRGATEPEWRQGDLRINVVYKADAVKGGAAGPNNGNPGKWWAADPSRPNLYRAALHEIGHTLGIQHSTVGETFPEHQRPIMNWSTNQSAPTLTDDDKAAISNAYPTTRRAAVSIRGFVRPQISGVNVIAVETETGRPVASRLTDPYGRFRLSRLPRLQYTLLFRDANSWRGTSVGVGGQAWMVVPYGEPGIQADNFEPRELPLPMINFSRHVGGVDLAMFPIGFDKISTKGSTTYIHHVKAFDGALPDASVGQPYSRWLRVQGGVRSLRATTVGLPAGVTAVLRSDVRGVNTGVRGAQWLHIGGTPISVGQHTLQCSVTDAHGQRVSLETELRVR